MHRNALYDPHIPPGAITQVWHIEAGTLFMETASGHPIKKNSASIFGGPDAPECTT
jgi:hypothetical protein